MKKIITIITAVLFLTFTECTDFSTSYQSVDEGEFRLLNIMFDSYGNTPEIAPGDSAAFTAVFAGKKKDLEDIEWRISFNVTVDNYGMQTAAGSDPIEEHGRILNRAFSGNTQTIAFRFKVPEDIVRKSASIPENWTDAFPSHMVSVLPEKLTSKTKNQIVDLIEKDMEYMRNNGYEMELDKKLLPALFQFFTVPIIITANIKNEGRQHKIQCSHSVRYNRSFWWLGSDIPININPRVDYAVVHKVKGTNMITFDYPYGGQYTSTRLRFNDTTDIIVEDGYSYFLEAYSRPFDRTITMDAALLAAISPDGETYKTGETHAAHWMFQLDKNEKKNVPFSKQMDINNLFGINKQLIVPKDKSIKNFTLWLTITDDVTNERLRPRGSTLEEYQVRFLYK